MVISPVAALHVRSVFHGAWLATSTTSYPLGPTQGPRIATIFAGRSPALNEACTTSAGMKAESPGPRMRFSRSTHCSIFPATTSTTSFLIRMLVEIVSLARIEIDVDHGELLAPVLRGSLSRLDVPKSSTLISISSAMTNFPDIGFFPSCIL